MSKTARKFIVNGISMEELEDLTLLRKKIADRLIEDAKTKVSTSTLLFFGFLLFIAVFTVSMFLLGKRPLSIGSESSGESILDQGSGRGLNPPPVVPPANTPEAEAYMERQERARNPEPQQKEQTPSQPVYPPATDKITLQYEYVDSLGNKISPADLSKYEIIDTQ